jgi:hypothetical protein
MQDLNLAGLLQKFRRRRGQLCQCQELARAALIIVQRAGLIGMPRFVAAAAVRHVATSVIDGRSMSMAVAMAVVMMVVPRESCHIVVVWFCRASRTRTASAEAVAVVVVVSHPRQLRRQQVRGEQR